MESLKNMEIEELTILSNQIAEELKRRKTLKKEKLVQNFLNAAYELVKEFPTIEFPIYYTCEFCECDDSVNFFEEIKRRKENLSAKDFTI